MTQQPGPDLSESFAALVASDPPPDEPATTIVEPPMPSVPHPAQRAPKVTGNGKVPGFEDLRGASMRDVVDPMVARMELAAQFPNFDIEPTGLDELDKHLKMRPNRLTVLAGRQGSGKSALALQWARYWADRGPVLVLLTEMSIEEVVERAVANAAQIPLARIQQAPSPPQRAHIQQVLHWLADTTDLYIVEAQGAPLHDIADRVRTFATAVDGMRAFIVDNLWGLAGASGATRGDAATRSVAIGEVVRELVTLTLPETSGGVDCLGLLVHHTNRGGIGEQQTHHLGGSDHIGNWADTVLILEKSAQTFGAASHTLSIAKQRGGAAELSIGLQFIGAQMRFETNGQPMQPFARPDAIDPDIEAAYKQALANMPEL